MFKSKIEGNLKADEISLRKDEDVCYEIVKESEEKLLTLEEARKYVEENYFLNKKELKKGFEKVCRTGNRNNVVNQYFNLPNEITDLRSLTINEDPQGRIGCSNSVLPGTDDTYVGRGYGLEDLDDLDTGYEVEEEEILDDTDEVVDTVDGTPRKVPVKTPIANYGKGAHPSWSNVFDDSSSDEN